MFTLAMAFLGGLLGSGHCVGMCGGFALVIGSQQPGAWHNLARQLVYSAGRIFTYSAIGAAAGFGGLWLGRHAPSLLNTQAALAVLAGVLLVGQGLHAGGWWPRWRWAWQPSRALSGVCLAGSLFAAFLRRPGWGNVFVAGMLTGLLPCGLVYAFVALATSTGHWLTGLAQMAAFGLGTVPLMLVTGLGGPLLGMATRQHVFRIAAVAILLAGGMSLFRGIQTFAASDPQSPPACPLCRSAAAIAPATPAPR